MSRKAKLETAALALQAVNTAKAAAAAATSSTTPFLIEHAGSLIGKAASAAGAVVAPPLLYVLPIASRWALHSGLADLDFNVEAIIIMMTST